MTSDDKFILAVFKERTPVYGFVAQNSSAVLTKS